MNGEERKEQGSPEEKPIDLRDLPPADFYSIVNMFQGLAVQLLGAWSDPSSEKTEAQLLLARYYIDCLGILDEKTRGNLNEEEKKSLDDILIRLRLLYVKLSSGPDQEGA